MVVQPTAIFGSTEGEELGHDYLIGMAAALSVAACQGVLSILLSGPLSEVPSTVLVFQVCVQIPDLLHQHHRNCGSSNHT